MRTPYDHQSAAVPCPFLLTTSGAIYSTVPQNEYVFFSSNRDSLLRPKSVTLICPSEFSSMLRTERGLIVKCKLNASLPVNATDRERINCEVILRYCGQREILLKCVTSSQCYGQREDYLWSVTLVLWTKSNITEMRHFQSMLRTERGFIVKCYFGIVDKEKYYWNASLPVNATDRERINCEVILWYCGQREILLKCVTSSQCYGQREN